MFGAADPKVMEAQQRMAAFVETELRKEALRTSQAVQEGAPSADQETKGRGQ